jgi:Cdc6-like AAA superfamily ATPase
MTHNLSDSISTDNNSVTKNIIDQLRKNNPFRAVTAPEPWSNLLPNVNSVHRDAFDLICSLIEQKSSSPRLPLAALILGEAGSGKTHLISRVLDYCRQHDRFFVFVRPLLDSQRPLHHLRQEIVINLTAKKIGQTYSQFDRILAELTRDCMRQYFKKRDDLQNQKTTALMQKLDENVFYLYESNIPPETFENIKKFSVDYISGQLPNVNKRLLTILFRYLDESLSRPIRDWLRGSELDEDDCKTLGITQKYEASIEMMENEARKFVLTLGDLLEHCNMPMAICFDQLDSMTETGLISQFGQIFHLLMNNAAGMLPLAFMRPDSWNEKFKIYLDGSIMSRLMGCRSVLYNCNRSQACEIIRRRVEQVFGETNKDSATLTQWIIEQVGDKFDVDRSTREVCFFASEAISDSKNKSVPISVQYRMICNEVASNFDKWDPDSEYLRCAAELFMKNNSDVLTCEKKDLKHEILEGKANVDGKETPYYCMINRSRIWQTARAIIEKGIEFIRENPNGICCFVNDERYNFSTKWTATIERLKKFEELGGRFLILDKDSSVLWFGLSWFYTKVTSGDIVVENDGGLKSLTETDFKNLLRFEFSEFAQSAQFDKLLIRPNQNDKTSEEELS